MAGACFEKIKLLNAYQCATESYSRSVLELSQTIGILSRPDYDALYRMTEALRYDATAAGDVLNAHVADHGC
jgi:hypothetical protein